MANLSSNIKGWESYPWKTAQVGTNAISQQKKNVVWGIRYRWDLLLSVKPLGEPLRSFAHFKRPWLNIKKSCDLDRRHNRNSAYCPVWIEKVSGRAGSDILYGQSWSPSAPLLIFTVGITSAIHLAGMQAVYWAKPENVHKKDHNLSLRPYLPTGFLGTTNISKVGVVPVRRISFLF